MKYEYKEFKKLTKKEEKEVSEAYTKLLKKGVGYYIFIFSFVLLLQWSFKVEIEEGIPTARIALGIICILFAIAFLIKKLRGKKNV